MRVNRDHAGRFAWAALGVAFVLTLNGCSSCCGGDADKKHAKPASTDAPATTTTTTEPVASAVESNNPAAVTDDGTKWTTLFDGKTLTNWKPTAFGGEGQIVVEEGELIIPAGATLSGITYAGDAPLPKTNYEIEVQARRRGGSDFFCGLTFPVADAHASLICGGWGGGLVGISSIDSMDASENSTTKYYKFEAKRWYTIRQRVLENRLQSWIDDEQLVDADITDRRINVRVEVRPSRPLGIATWQTDAGVRSIKIRELTPEEIKASAEAK